MKIFAFDPADYRGIYSEQGWVHVKSGITPEFLAELRAFASESLAETNLGQFAIKGKKEQSLYEFPADVAFPDEIFDVAADTCGLNRPTMTVSERHIQAYEANANPEPAPHKDRYPSQVSLGFSIDIPAGSTLVLYPRDDRAINPFNSAALHYRSLQPHQRPEVTLAGAEAVEIADEAGDVVMFPGSSTWHLRRNAARSINLYVKLNDFDRDPLGEDPHTQPRRDRSLELLRTRSAEQLDEYVVATSRRLDYVSREARGDGLETRRAALYGDDPLWLTETQLELLRSVDGRQALKTIVDSVANGTRARDDVERDARALIDQGLVDLIV